MFPEIDGQIYRDIYYAKYYGRRWGGVGMTKRGNVWVLGKKIKKGGEGGERNKVKWRRTPPPKKKSLMWVKKN